jgi:hypothetical protein
MGEPRVAGRVSTRAACWQGKGGVAASTSRTVRARRARASSSLRDARATSRDARPESREAPARPEDTHSGCSQARTRQKDARGGLKRVQNRSEDRASETGRRISLACTHTNQLGTHTRQRERCILSGLHARKPTWNARASAREMHLSAMLAPVFAREMRVRAKEMDASLAIAGALVEERGRRGSMDGRCRSGARLSCRGKARSA